MNNADQIARAVPVNPRTFMILLAFAGGSRYGYEVKKAVDVLSGGQVRLDAGSLYRAIAKLVDDGWIREAETRAAPDRDDERRRYYELTALGREVVAAEASRLNDLVEFARGNDLLGSTESTR
jgi:DNA-binding PadR family transcriptional regulator